MNPHLPESAALTAASLPEDQLDSLFGQKKLSILPAGKTLDFAWDHRGRIAGIVLPIAAAALSGCSVEDLGPESVSQRIEPIIELFSSWGNIVALGLAGGALNGFKAFVLRREDWKRRDVFLGAIEKMETQAEELRAKNAPREQLEGFADQLEELRGRINPFWSTVYVAKEAGEGFMAGSMSQVAYKYGSLPEANSIEASLLYVNAGFWIFKAFSR